MKVDYNPETDTATIQLAPGVPDGEGEEVWDGVIVYCDEDDCPLKIELYDGAAEKLARAITPPADGHDGDELASAVGRAWLAGYRTGRADEYAVGAAARTSATEALGLTALYTPTGDGRWMARVPELPGAVSQGETLEEVRENMADAVGLLLKVRREEADRELEDREGAIREPLPLRPATEPEALEIHELPYYVAMEILTKNRGYSVGYAEEYLAISRGESMDDVIYETEEEGRASAAAPTEDED